jgi:preprotein translocase subunit YajC
MLRIADMLAQVEKGTEIIAAGGILGKVNRS